MGHIIYVWVWIVQIEEQNIYIQDESLHLPPQCQQQTEESSKT